MPRPAQAFQGLYDAQAKGSAKVAEDAVRFAENVMPVIERIKAGGITSLRGIAVALDARGVRTARGGKWKAMQVAAVLRRAETLTSS